MRRTLIWLAVITVCGARVQRNPPPLFGRAREDDASVVAVRWPIE